MKALLLASSAVLAIGLAQSSAGAADYLVAPATFDWSGLYVGLHAGHFSGYADVVDGTITFGGPVEGFIGGALVGYGWQYNNIVLGIEGDVGLSNASGTGGLPAPVLYDYDLHWNAHLRGVLGFAHGMAASSHSSPVAWRSPGSTSPSTAFPSAERMSAGLLAVGSTSGSPKRSSAALKCSTTTTAPNPMTTLTPA
jgi:outer membrane immunogenic protein